ncbi:hypothetical protein [Pseudonocardia acaciae]|uniref:hypothetical protein n=1 Tax=Pseudonocardia acaciae TaxID=551276 RepID=UPI00048D2F3E|nr:hypothetical protein [Pseudonocardia acaciae]
MSRPRIGLLHGGASYHLATLADPVVTEHVTHPLYLPEQSALDTLSTLDTVIVCDRLHPGLLREHAGTLREVPERGGTLVVLGEVEAHTWLPGLRWSPRPTNFWWWRTGEDPGIHTHAPDHPIWNHLNHEDVIWHYHGLLHPPAGATVLASADDPAGAILYEDRASPGRLVVTTMDPVHHHGSNFMPAATRLLHGLLHWLAAETAAA